ncbi:MAG: Swt1 family HEPN domain-containing protein, partial [Acidimicrobiales bacterium]
MALSNRERVGRAFEVLASGLGPYVDRRMRATSRSGRLSPGTGLQGQSWVAEFAASARPPLTGEVSLGDPALQLRVMVEAWESAFAAELGKAERNLVFELRQVRNRWAHNDAFSVDDAYRALDSVERLLVAIDAREAAEVGRGKEDLMRQRFEAQARRVTPRDEALLTQPAAGLAPWREVIQPHDDVVVQGRFSLAEFAADLHQVSLGEGADEYAAPVAFFERTFLTAGLQDLLGEAVVRLSGRGGPPVVDLQTSFGGGKTHSMIALYHLFSGTALDAFPQEVQDLVRAKGVTGLPEVDRAVLVGTRISPGQGDPKPDGTTVGTLWGELAWQLGGAEGYAMVAEADRTRTNPGDALRRLLAAHAPCLVLIDEWVAYARQLYADDTLLGGTLDTHISFAQTLTEAARVTGALVVVSIPASEASGRVGAGASPAVGSPAVGSPAIGSPAAGSDAEIGGHGGREALRRLRGRGGPHGVGLAPGHGRGELRDRPPPAVPAHRVGQAGRPGRHRIGLLRAVPPPGRRVPARVPGPGLRRGHQAGLPDPPGAVRPPVRGLVDPGARPAHPGGAAPHGHRGLRLVVGGGPV